MGRYRRNGKGGIFAALAVSAVIATGATLAYAYWDDVSLGLGKAGHWLQSTFGLEVSHQKDEDSLVVVDSTCSEEGSKTWTCKICGEDIVEIIEKKPHSEVLFAGGVPSTCTQTGLTPGMHCDVCGEVTIPQIETGLRPHTEVALDEIAPTCTETGLTAGSKCSECGEVIVAQEEVAALGHTYVDGACLNCGEAEPVFVDNLSKWTMPASEGYIVDGNALTFAGTHELTFSTKEMYNSISLTFTVSETQDVRGAFQIGWGAQSPYSSINALPYVQFNYDRAVLCLPDGTTYDTSWTTGQTWRLTIDVENSNVVLSVDGEVVYNVDASWWTKDNWGFPGYLLLRAESNCALTFELTQMNPIA